MRKVTFGDLPWIASVVLGLAAFNYGGVSRSSLLTALDLESSPRLQIWEALCLGFNRGRPHWRHGSRGASLYRNMVLFSAFRCNQNAMAAQELPPAFIENEWFRGVYW
jgi:hypothetical protein